LVATVAGAQGPEIEIDLTATDVISQGRTGTCWSFSTTSFLESEAFRVSGALHDFSEMACSAGDLP
jgi:bleomycin hydrolase